MRTYPARASVILIVIAFGMPVAHAGPARCSGEGAIRSLRGDLETRVRFTNLCPYPVAVDWLTYVGQRKRYFTLPPGGTVLQPTFMSHPWVVTDPAGACLALVISNREEQTLTLCGASAPLS